MKYVLVSSLYEDEFIDDVNKHLADGWKLQGGVSVVRASEDYYRYSQAMTKDDPVP